MSLKKISPIELLLWTFRRNERDTVNMYRSLSGIMRLATGGDMLNFGYWGKDTPDPLSAQERLCSEFGRLARLSSGQRVLDVGSGYGAPALQWRSEYDAVDIFSVNTSFEQLSGSSLRVQQVGATATALPFGGASVDRILALESAQHFKPFAGFASESFRVLKKDGLLALAIPVLACGGASLGRLGLLSLTWSSEHYTEQHVMAAVKGAGFEVVSVRRIGPGVYEPLADYYEANRASVRDRILISYPDYVEKILHRSIRKMRDVSQKKFIDYLLVLCRR